MKDEINQYELTGKDFEFLIVPADIEIKAEDFDRLMTPDTISWIKIIKEGWVYYQVEKDEFSYSMEISGIQMTFNLEMPYAKARTIADEVMKKLSAYCNQKVEVLFIPKNKIISF